MRKRFHSFAAAGIIAVLSGFVAGRAGQDSAAASAPAESAPARLDPVVDRILTRLEQREIRDLRAEVAWKLQYLTDDPEEALTRRGQIWYRRGEPTARFLVHFSEKIQAGRREPLEEKHLFDGRWYIELQSQTRHVSRREVRREDDPSDPFRLGEGPFPVPFGQRKADILREFEVARIEASGEGPADTDRLRLTPRPGTSTAQTYQWVEFWIAREGAVSGLPLQVRAAKLKGTGQLDAYITVTFRNAELNVGLSESLFRIETPPGYQETVEPLAPREPPPAPGGQP